tara:strand:+ start:47227 stop:48792 length:1566 start_codon:yes stop_codon:yes gene_type:complete
MTNRDFDWAPLLSGEETTPEERLEYLYRRMTEMTAPALPKSLEAFENAKPEIQLQHPLQVQAFVDEALSRLPTAEARQVSENIANAGEATAAALQDLFKRVLPYFGENFAASTYERFVTSAYDKAFDAFAAVVNASARHNDRRTVVFVARSSFNLIQREALYLKRNGYKVFLINLVQVSAALRPAFDQSFDLIFDGIGTYPALGNLLRRLEPDVFHVQCWMHEYFMARFVNENKKSGKLVCEFYDITSIYADRSDLKKLFWDQLVDLDLAMERYIFQQAAGVVHRFPEHVIDELSASYGGSTRHIEMQQFVCPEYASNRDAPRNDKIRLVYIGGLIPRNENHPHEMFPEWGHAEAWKLLLDQGFAIDIYNSLFRRFDEPGLEHLHDLATKYPDFQLLSGIPQDKLAQTIGQYDFGLILAEMDIESSWCTDQLFAHCVGTKLFSYLEAGLPVIVNSEYEYMKNILENDGMGFGLASSDIVTASEKIKTFDTESARANIRRFNEEHGMDKEISRLISLYRGIC